METLKVDGGDVENLTNWKAKQLLKNVILGTLVPFQKEHVILHVGHPKSKPLVGLNI